MKATTRRDLSAYAEYARHKPAKYLFYSVFLEIAAWVVAISPLPLTFLVIFLAIKLTDLHNFTGLPYPVRLLLQVYFVLYNLIIVPSLFVKLRRIRKRYSLNSKRELINERRRPFLYLWSFDKSEGSFFKTQGRRTHEEMLKTALNDIGPLIAVGRPDEKLPPLGAIRVYFTDQQWQDKVIEMMSFSELVIVRAGYSPGLEWEMQTTMERLDPERLVYSFLSWQELEPTERQSEYEIFKMQLKRLCNISLPEQIGNAYFLYFDKDWTPHLEALSSRRKFFFQLPSMFKFISELYLLMQFPILALRGPKYLQAYREPSITSIRETLRPLLQRKNINLKRWKTILYTVLALIVIVTVISLVAFVLLFIATLGFR